MYIWIIKKNVMNILLLVKDSVVVDTTQLGYRIGYTIASWIPFLIIAFIVLMIIRKRYRLNE